TNVETALDNMEFSVALSHIWKYISRTNKYIDETQPWVLAKDDSKKGRLGNVMAHLTDSLRRVGILLQPFLTQTPNRIFEQIGVEDETLHSWETLLEFGVPQAGAKVVKKDPIFPRLDVEKEVKVIKDLMKKPAPEKKAATQEETNEITYDEFMKLDLRVAEVTHAEKMKNADKLLRIQLDLGTEKRQVVSGIAPYYTPESLVGKKVICVTNLKPV